VTRAPVPSVPPSTSPPAPWRGRGPLLVIAGTCVVESRESALDHARALADMARDLGLPLVFKASYDKANRTAVDSFRGPGVDEGLAILAEVRAETGLPLLTDVHEPAQCATAAAVVDVLQIPAFLCRQTDLLLAAASTGRAVNVKKGQFLAPEDAEHIVGKLRAGGARGILLTERGTTFGYNNLVVDFRSIPTMRAFGVPVVFDATHSVQRPGGRGGSSGGDPQHIRPWPARPSRPGRTPSSSRSIATRRAPCPTARTRCGWSSSPPCSARCARSTGWSAAAPGRMPGGPAGEARRGATRDRGRGPGARGAGRSARPGLRRRGRRDPGHPRPRRPDRHGQERPRGRKIAATLASTGTPALFLHPAEAIHGDLG